MCSKNAHVEPLLSPVGTACFSTVVCEINLKHAVPTGLRRQGCWLSLHTYRSYGAKTEHIEYFQIRDAFSQRCFLSFRVFRGLSSYQSRL